MSTFVERWVALPRAARWGVLGVVGIGMYFAAVDPILALQSKWADRADSKEAELQRFASERLMRKSADEATALGISRFGDVAPPGAATATSEAVNTQITRVLGEQEIGQPTITSREQAMTSGPMASKLAADERLQRLVTDIKFEATPDRCVRVLAALEQCPEVSTISRVQFSTPTGTDKAASVVRAWLTVETWQVAKKGRGR